MKLKSLFLSMCAMAALASCSQNDEIVTPTGSEAPEAKVILKLEGNGVDTRAAGDRVDATEEGAKIKNITVFFFNGGGGLIGQPQYAVAEAAGNTLPTTTDAKRVVVLANLNSDLTGSVFGSVKTLDQLKAIDFSSITTAGGTHTVNQNKDNLYSSGMAALAEFPAGDSPTVNATVWLNFVSARIHGVKLSWKNDQHYAPTDQNFIDDKSTWFTIKKVYLMTAQTKSPLIPHGAGSEGEGAWWSGGFAPNTPAFAGGVSWGAAPWIWPTGDGAQPVQTDGYLVSTMPAAVSNSIGNVLGTGDANNPWYVFENASATHMTGIVVEFKWRSKANSALPAEHLTKYFTVYFGEDGARPKLIAGRTYDIALTFNGDFTPGGNAGGGGENPDKPSVGATVSVSVKVAQWVTTDEISKEFE